MTQVRNDIEEAKQTEEVIGKKLDDIAANVEFLASLTTLETAIDVSGLPDADKDALRQKIGEARILLRDGKREEAERKREDIKSAISQHTANATLAPQRDAFLDAFVRVGPKTTQTERAKDDAAARTRKAKWYDRALGKLAGINVTSAVYRYWLWRPLLAIVLLVVLVLLGLQYLYVGIPTFGSTGLPEYFGLFVWGVSAEVATATLQRLPARRT
jgi:hypothetical protein